MDKYLHHSSVVTDEQIIQLYWERNTTAIQETDKKYGRMLLNIAHNILHNSMDSEECQNDTYLKVWNAIPPTRPHVFPAFITQVIRRIAINRYKEKTRQKRIPSELTLSLTDLEDALHTRNDTEALYEAKILGSLINQYLRMLNPRQRYIFIDRYYLAEPVETIAKDLSVSVPTIYREIDKIKSGLRRHLKRNGIYL